MRWSAISARRPVDRDVAAHGVRAELDQRRVAPVRNVGHRELRGDVAAARPGIDEQARAFLDPDAQVAGGRPQVDTVLKDAADLLVARRGVDRHRAEHLLDEHVARSGARLEPPAHGLEHHVARGGVDPAVAADHPNLDVPRGGVQPSLAADQRNLDVAARRADLGVAGDVGEMDVSGAGLDVYALEQPAALDLGRARLDLDGGLERARDRDQDLGSTRPAEAAVAGAHVHDHVLAVGALVQLDPGALHRVDRRLVVAQRLERYGRLALGRAGVDPDLAGAVANVQPNGAGGLESLRSHRARRRLMRSR